MIAETVRLVSAWLEHKEHGVNELAGSLPRERLGGYPADDRPPVLPIFNDADDDGTAKDLDPPQLPALLVWGDSSVDVKLDAANRFKIAKAVTIAVAFFTRPDVPARATSNACGYILRGATLSLGRFNDTVKSRGYRALNGITILQVSDVTEERYTAAEGRRKMWGFLRVTVIAVEGME